MFCPNCGNNCENANFCPKCGTKLPQQAGNEVAVWQIGMPCPHCGGTKLENDHCAFCGALLREEVVCEEEKAEDASYDTIFRRYYTGAAHYHYHITKNEFIVEKKGFFRTTQIHIPYSQVVELSFVRKEDACAAIIFRWNEGEVIQTEELGIGYGDWCRSEFHIFNVFRLLVPHAEFTMRHAQADIACVDKFAGTINMEEYFNRYTPCREQAAETIAREYALKQWEADRLVDAYFNRRQTEIYEESPVRAAIDNNLYIAERHRLYEEFCRKQAERHAARTR